MKLAKLLTSLLLLASVALADDATILRQWIPSQPTRETAALVNALAVPVAWSTNQLQTVTTNDVSQNVLRGYLRNNAPAGVTAQSTPAQIRTAWTAALTGASTTAAKLAVLDEKSFWMAMYAVYQLQDDVPSFTTNTVQQITVTQRRWQALGLSRQPNGSDVEAAQR